MLICYCHVNKKAEIYIVKNSIETLNKYIYIMNKINNKKKKLNRSANVFICCFMVMMSFAAFNNANAQVSAYTFSYSAGTYTPISGTIDTSGTWDDGNSALITLPFTFNYNGYPYTTVGINWN